ncbi:MAG: Spy/CpxP family protein refolding chaperone [Aquabacterium sp.]
MHHHSPRTIRHIAAAIVLLSSQAWAQGPASAPASAASPAPMAVEPAASAAGAPHSHHEGKRYGDRADSKHRQHGMHAGLLPFLHAGPQAERYTERFLKRIQATDAQAQAIRAVAKKARDQRAPLMHEGRALHQEARRLWAQPQLDEKALDQLRIRMNAHHQRMTDANHGFMLEVARILTPAQRAQLAESMHERRAKHHSR